MPRWVAFEVVVLDSDLQAPSYRGAQNLAAVMYEQGGCRVLEVEGKSWQRGSYCVTGERVLGEVVAPTQKLAMAEAQRYWGQQVKRVQSWMSIDAAAREPRPRFAEEDDGA